MRTTMLTSLLLSLAVGCSSAGSEDDPLGDTLDDGKADSLSSPTNHNDYFFGTRVDADVSGSARYHAWQFTLDGKATVNIESYNRDFSTATDTALYLYKKGTGSTWSKVQSRSTDDGSDPSISRELKKGTYRIIVKGKTKATEEAAAMSATCEGDGCPFMGDGCLFGKGGVNKLPDSYVHQPRAGSDFFTRDSFSDADPSDADAAAIVEAYRAATDSDPDTLDAVFDGIKDGVVEHNTASDNSTMSYRRYDFETSSGKKVTAFFRALADDHSQGAIMVGSSMKSCHEAEPICAFGFQLGDLAEHYDEVDVAYFTSPRELSDLQKEQLAKAAYSAENAVATIDGFTFSRLRGDDGSSYDVVRFDDQLRDGPNGPHMYGLIFAEGTTRVVARINADALDRCAVTREAPRRAF